MSTEEQKAPKIEFPCAYPLKIVGNAAPDLKAFVLQVIKKHDPSHDGSATLRDSKNGNYQAINVTITATGEDQLQAIFEELKASGRIQMVL
ncbi:DUF493 domain-containing protein [Kistimonas scapharcae]|uniref:UPF0250 protein GCM10023116_42460 n=1 Tax=Kistimonas scapharcae TaxID=1036133 RepID=A0ABP8VAH8_9GAMM